MSGMIHPATHVFTGFDSAWTDNAARPGALAHIVRSPSGGLVLVPPVPATFARALAEVRRACDAAALHILGIDQPTVVPNAAGTRPVDKVVAAVISRLKGGVQPASRSRAEMFGDGAPIWRFLAALPHRQTPMEAVQAEAGHHVMEVFPALALPGLSDAFAERLPKYNPANRAKFAPADWQAVLRAIMAWAAEHTVAGVEAWAAPLAEKPRPTKADQDGVDAVICAVIALSWWTHGPARNILVGRPDSGYIVAPASPWTRAILTRAAATHGVGVDEAWPESAVWRDAWRPEAATDVTAAAP